MFLFDTPKADAWRYRTGTASSGAAKTTSGRANRRMEGRKDLVLICMAMGQRGDFFEVGTRELKSWVMLHGAASFKIKLPHSLNIYIYT